jgi:hypothetical protein
MADDLARIVERQAGLIDTLVRRCDDLNLRLVETEVTLRAMKRINHPPPPASIVRKSRGEDYHEDTPNIAAAELWGEA